MANRILLGRASTARGGDTKYGLWISKPGQDVTTCTDDQLIFNTDKGGTGDIKSLFQLQNANTSASTAVTSVSANISAGATTNVSFSNISFNFGVIAFGRGGLGTGNAAAQVRGQFQINSVSGGSINVTNLDSSSARTLEFTILPQHGNAFY
tara:strand:- start:2818 stop:3273 length:456 start_codon:yes stop_codon:yes gene_type:complete